MQKEETWQQADDIPVVSDLAAMHPSAKKKISEAIQIESAGAVVLKTSLWSPSCFSLKPQRNDRPSRVTVIVPAAVPNNRTEVKTNVSETEIVAGIDGNLTVIDPLSSVRAASRNHCDVTGVNRGT